MNVKLERAKIGDISSLLKLWKEMMDYHKKLGRKDFQLKSNAQQLMKKWFIKNIRSKNSIVLKAVINQKIIGYLIGFIDELPPVYKHNKYGYISDGVITAEHRNKGIMKKMIKEAARFFKKKGLKELGLKVYTKNIDGIKAWSNIGFKEDAKLMFMNIK